MMHNLKLLAALGCVCWATTCSAAVVVENQRCEYLVEPIGIDAQAPRLTWTVDADGPLPESFVVKVALSEKGLRSGKEVWRSPLVSGDSRRVVLDTEGVLAPHTRYVWQVEGTDGSGVNFTSPVASFETGKLGAADWSAKWISDGKDKEFEPAPMLRKEFEIKKLPAAARAYVSAAGYYDLWINGERVGDSRMDPGYTHYDKRNLYATHDVTPLLRKGKNVVSAVLGNGFYNCQSKAVWDFETARWRNRPALMLEITGTDKKGNVSVLAMTDESWKGAVGPYTYNNIYSGDRYD
ncbi:MAG: alpha-L-rhamnosidase N-terminal domain-containing protein, partial [Muribaculaceae bacterium]|nr:alpha-L-rhamnosidase N-terminal domain-containing protein [Muribaculaceae bacterium]